MTTSRLRLFQLISPALPVGAFSYSEGLEVQVQRGLLLDGAGVRAWLEAELQRGTLALEAASLPGLLLAEPAELRERDSWLLALREAAEVRAQHRQMGASLLGLLADLGFNPPALNLAWPAAFALAGRALEVAATELVEAYLYGWVANQLSAALRLVPLGPTEAQRLQLGLAPLIAERALELVAADPDQLWSGGVGAGLAQLRHAELYSRLFRS
ncbi:urease accessory protein UreF [Cyanobium sp. T1G-Tous]|uniref:urease accessory protein UreF n=1 Tax=Cyanobium sp. T1G-Tous TaxID=2823722 RepID=UPI0020CF34DD|nr:urease accessory UreF family protein [Cyanobium sp. T1G-Tous]MCP9802211.1 urease accessory protein UreF [Cyanobium sp. T1G-Tous]